MSLYALIPVSVNSVAIICLISMLGDKYGKNNVSLVSCKNVSSFESAIQSGTDSTDYSEQLAATVEVALY